MREKGLAKRKMIGVGRGKEGRRGRETEERGRGEVCLLVAHTLPVYSHFTAVCSAMCGGSCQSKETSSRHVAGRAAGAAP